MASNTALAVAVNVFTSPGEAFASIREKPRVFLPIVLLLLGFGAVSFTYMNTVDMGWFMDNQLQQANVAMTDAQREQAVANAARIPPMVYGAIGGITTSLFVGLVIVITALYYTGVSFATGDGIKLKQWLALVCWCLLPVLLGIIAQLVHLTVTDARFMPQDEINPLSFGSLLSIDRTGATIVQRILLSIDITTLWSLAITVLGYQAWTKSSTVKAVAVVLGPLALIIVVASLFALR